MGTAKVLFFFGHEYPYAETGKSLKEFT